MNIRYAYKLDLYDSYDDDNELWLRLTYDRLYSSLEAIEAVIGESIPREKPTLCWEINGYEHDWDCSGMGEPAEWRGSIEGGSFDKIVRITRVELREEFCTAYNL